MGRAHPHGYRVDCAAGLRNYRVVFLAGMDRLHGRLGWKYTSESVRRCQAQYSVVYIATSAVFCSVLHQMPATSPKGAQVDRAKALNLCKQLGMLQRSSCTHQLSDLPLRHVLPAPYMESVHRASLWLYHPLTILGLRILQGNCYLLNTRNWVLALRHATCARQGRGQENGMLATNTYEKRSRWPQAKCPVLAGFLDWPNLGCPLPRTPFSEIN